MQPSPRKQQEPLLDIIIERLVVRFLKHPLLGLFIIISTATIFATSAELLAQRFLYPREVTLHDRIQELTHSLSEATDVVAAIESEVNKRMSLVAKLEQKAREAEQLSDLSREQAEAVALRLRSELNRGWWVTIVVGLLVSFAGSVASYYYGRFVERGRNGRNSVLPGPLLAPSRLKRTKTQDEGRSIRGFDTP